MMKKSSMAALLLSSAVLVTACGAGAPQNGSGTENSGTVKTEGRFLMQNRKRRKLKQREKRQRKRQRKRSQAESRR